MDWMLMAGRLVRNDGHFSGPVRTRPVLVSQPVDEG